MDSCVRTLEARELDKTREFYEQCLGLETRRTSPHSLMIRLGGENTIAVVQNPRKAGDAALSSHFAKPGADKFAALAERFTPGLGGAPALGGAVATFECHSRHRYYGGDHIIVIGVVERYQHTASPALAFHRGRYAEL